MTFSFLFVECKMGLLGTKRIHILNPLYVNFELCGRKQAVWAFSMASIYVRGKDLFWKGRTFSAWMGIIVKQRNQWI